MGYWKEIAMEMQENRGNSRLASILGITQDELDQLDYEIETESGDDDAVYGYRVEFSPSSPKKILRKVKRLEDGCRVNLGLWEMGDYADHGQDDYDEQYEAIIGDKDYYQKFLNEMDNLRQLNQLSVTPFPLETILKRQLFISVIGALETFLADTFINLTFDNEEFFKNFVETHPDFKQRKFELREIFAEIAKLRETAKKVMLDMIYHNLPTISSMFIATFKAPFPNIKSMYALVLTRHDLVHRNGKTKDGVEVTTDTAAIEKLIDETTSFVNELSATLSKVTIVPIDDPDDLPF